MIRKIKVFAAILILGATPTALANPCSSVLTNSNEQAQLLEAENRANFLLTKYRERLGARVNPFATVWTPSQGEILFQKLLKRSTDTNQYKSPLWQINNATILAIAKNAPLNIKLINWILTQAEKNIASDFSKTLDLQSNALALKYSLNYLRRYKIFNETVDRDGKKIKSDQSKPEKQQPRYPEFPKNYKPHTKELGKKATDTANTMIVASANFITRYFGQQIYPTIVRNSDTPFQEASLTMSDSQVAPFQHSSTVLTLYPTKNTLRYTLFIPTGTKPIQASDPRTQIVRDESGSYTLTLTEHLDQVEIPLVENEGIQLTHFEQDIYTSQVGIEESEWPDVLQDNVFHKFKKNDPNLNPLTVAAVTRNTIATEYKYSQKAQPETDPIEALEAGSFQCDMAAYVMVGVLRAYKIPSRIVGGLRSKVKTKQKDGHSYVVTPAEGHAWVEVFANGRWHAFDPTPETKSEQPKKDDEQNKTENEFSDVPGETGNKEQKAATKEKRELKKSLPALKKEPEEKNELLEKSAIPELEIGSISLKPSENKNQLIDRSLRTLLRISLTPDTPSTEILNKLGAISRIIRYSPNKEIWGTYQNAVGLHTQTHPSLRTWIREISNLIRTQDVNTSYAQIVQLRKCLELYVKLLDRSTQTNYPVELLTKLENAQRTLTKLAHQDSEDIEIVREFVRPLPFIVRQILKNDYDFDFASNNPPTKKIAEHLRTKKLSQLRLISSLMPLSDFTLNSTPRPEYEQVKSWNRDLKKRRGRDILQFQRLSEWNHALLGQPGKSLEENISENTAYVVARRKIFELPTGRGNEEAERRTIVLFDTSGSMSSDHLSTFQAALIAAFTARSLSDRSPSGKLRHKVVLIPFDSLPGTPLIISSVEDAIDIVRNYKSRLENTNGGTNIQHALLQAFAAIADAQERAGEPLAAANIILMSDGGSTVDLDVLAKARASISRDTPVQTMFIGINNTNQELIELASSSAANKMGTIPGLYREFHNEQIQQFIADSTSTANLKLPNSFYTEKTGADIPESVFNDLDSAQILAEHFLDNLENSNRYSLPSEHLEEFEFVHKWKNESVVVDRALERFLKKWRQFMDNPVFNDQTLQHRILHDIYTNFDAITGIKREDLTNSEAEHLRHALRDGEARGRK